MNPTWCRRGLEIRLVISHSYIAGNFGGCLLFHFHCQFLAIVKNKSFPKSSNLLLDIAKLLLCHAHYSSSSDQLHIAAVEPQVQRLCSTRLMGVLAELCTLTTPTKPTKKGDVMHICSKTALKLCTCGCYTLQKIV